MGREDLAETLVANGLARVDGAPAKMPGGQEPAVEKRKLTQLEITARSQKLGGWGVRAGRLNNRAASTAPAATPAGGGDSFDAFFHSSATPAPPTAARSGLLDINRATSEELQRLPGIGPVLAGRIIAARPFASADDLARVSGIGDRKYAVLRPYFE